MKIARKDTFQNKKKKNLKKGLNLLIILLFTQLNDFGYNKTFKVFITRFVTSGNVNKNDDVSV